MREMKDSGIEWIGELPLDWEIIRFKFVVKNSIERADDNTNYIGLENVESWTGKLLPSQNEAFEAEGGTLLVERGDVLFGKLRPYLAKCHIAENKGSCSTEFLVIKGRGLNEAYVRYMMTSSRFIEEVNMSTYGAKMPRASWNMIGNMYVPYPSKLTQNKISSFLDAKCSQIDNIISKQEQIIEKLKEYKLSIITEAVTKGLDPDVEMKDSGVEWLGSVPKSWTLYRIASLYYQTSEQGKDELPILTVSINTGISDRELDDDEQDRVFVRSEDRSKYKRVQPGDLVYNMMRAWQGAFGAARVEGMVSPAYITCRPKPGIEIDTRYIEYLFRTKIAIEEMHRYSHGIADFRLRLYWPEFKNIRLCLPSLDEQRKIADYIDKKAGAIDKSVLDREKTVEKLRDYKKSLIYEVVTGKKEV